MENNSSLKTKIKKSLFWKFFEKISVQGINLLVQIVLARIILPELFGNLAIIVAITNYAAIFVQSGVSTVIIRQESIDKKDISTLFISSMAFATILYALLFFLAPTISCFYNTDSLVWPLRVLSLILFLNSINSIQLGIYSRNMEFRKMFIRSIIAVPISGAVGIILAIKGFGIWSLVVHNLLNMFLVVTVMAFDKKTWFKPVFSFQSFKKLYAFTSKIILTGIITGGGDFIRTLIIGKKYTKDDLAYYDKAYTYSNYTTQIVGQTITSVMLPSFSRVQDDGNHLKAMARKSIGISAFIMFPVLLGIASVAEPFIRIVLTDKWIDAIPFLMIFCILRMPSFISSIDKQVYYALGRSGINLIYESIFLALNISCLFVCIRFGIMWIAIGVTILEWLGCISLFVVSSKVYDYSLLERIGDVWKPLLNSLTMFLVTYKVGTIISPLVLRMIIQIIVGIIVYFSLSVFIQDNNLKLVIDSIKRRQRHD